MSVQEALKSNLPFEVADALSDIEYWAEALFEHFQNEIPDQEPKGTWPEEGPVWEAFSAASIQLAAQRLRKFLEQRPAERSPSEDAANG